MDMIDCRSDTVSLPPGADHSAAIVAFLAYRLLSFWIPAAFGLPLAMVLGRSHVVEPVGSPSQT
ncbi:MAG: hypothetical protein WBM50_04360 [Acidimicrobiales bacterium]